MGDRTISHRKPQRFGWSALAPGILIAATGVGAGDLLTASLGGSAIGLAILWAALAGAVLKWFLNEGLARWQMATGTTLLEGWVTKLGSWIQWVFLVYLLIWSVFTAGAMVNACGVAGTGLAPLSDDPRTSKIIWGVIHSLVGLVLVRLGGFKLFERMMSLFIGMMFVTVIATALLCKPDWSAVASGLALPTLPLDSSKWVLGLLGGVGGTVTLMSYGYWIREAGREGEEGLASCRLDLTVGYTMTALFGISMVIIGSQLDLEKGAGGLANVAMTLANQLATTLGPAGRWVFLIGFWGAVASSLLGVWQSVPYLAADFFALRGRRSNPNGAHRADDASAPTDPTPLDFTKTKAYRYYLFGLAFLSLPLLWLSVKQVQVAYAVFGSLFMPLLALTLLIMNNRRDWVGERFRNGPIANTALVATLVFFLFMLIRTIGKSLA